MNTALRKSHRTIFLIMAPSLLLVYASALYFRHPVTVMQDFPASLASQRPRGTAMLLSKKVMRLANIPTTVRSWKFEGKYWLSLYSQETWPEPDMLLYWQKSKQKELSPKAYLLGALSGQKKNWFTLPTGLASQQGIFILYSLGHTEVISAFHRQGVVE